MSKFEYDESKFKKMFAQTIAVEACAAAILIVAAVLYGESYFGTLIYILVSLLSVVLLWDVLSFTSRVKNMKSSSLVINSSDLRFVGKKQFSLPFNDLNIKKVQRDKTGNVTLILLGTRFKQNLKIVGLKDMEKAYQKLQEVIQ
ncbi:hypothetical protein [Reinekea blandensis]|uniref:Uncharacterized protein n=1 Tax=Reinekea blandensis MED297 TaxID=314283 RepID=A4B8V9_9GAMM|nr:hypothetical protein [Reinekea blandensis]EAR11060.1 hypothetical protein MED297_19272 [Reinekea sp. MED297] [Reinekea blandensis MED297]